MVCVVCISADGLTVGFGLFSLLCDIRSVMSVTLITGFITAFILLQLFLIGYVKFIHYNVKYLQLQCSWMSYIFVGLHLIKAELMLQFCGMEKICLLLLCLA